MKFGFYTPNFDYCGDAKLLAELAYEAEQAGWDGFFIWDYLQVIDPAADPWVALVAMAVRTERIRLGPLVTPCRGDTSPSSRAKSSHSTTSGTGESSWVSARDTQACPTTRRSATAPMQGSERPSSMKAWRSWRS